jgi:hypothetical protein
MVGMEEETPIPEPKHSVFAVWNWPHHILWYIVFLAAAGLFLNIAYVYNRHIVESQLSARRAKIGPVRGRRASTLPIRAWESELRRLVHDSPADALMPDNEKLVHQRRTAIRVP